MRTHRKKLISGTQDRWCNMDEEQSNENHCEFYPSEYKYDCTPQYYEFYEDGHRYHGYECGVCGKLLQTG